MKPISLAPVVAVVATASVLSQSPDVPDQVPRLLRARAARDLPSLGTERGEPILGNVLWSLQAADNAVAVRGLDDVDGDGVSDAVSGNDISGTADNLFAISGASRGAASVVWSIETQGGASGGSFWGDECLTVASDFTGDGVRDLLGGTAWGGRSAICFDASDGSVVWQLDTYNEAQSGWVYNIREMPDVTGDGVPEVIFGCGSDNDSVYCIDGASRGLAPTVLWSYEALDAVFAVNWVPDVSGDGLPDVIAGSGDNDGRIYCLRSNDGGVVWVHDPGGTIQSMETIADVDGDGLRDIVAATWGSGREATCVSSADGQAIWAQSAIGGLGMKVAPLRDVDGDGIEEVLVGSWANAITCLRGGDGALLWSTAAGTQNGGDVWTVSAIPDVNGDGTDDALGGSFDTRVYCCDGRTGAVLWSRGTQNRVFSVSWAGDQNGDGKPEALAGTQDTSNTTLVYGIEGDSGLVPPYLVLTGTGAIGTTVDLHTTGLPGEAFVLLLSFGPGSVQVGGFGTLLLDPTFLLVLAAGGIPSDGTAENALPLPGDPAFIGLPLDFQSLVGPDLFAGLGKFTNAVGTVVN